MIFKLSARSLVVARHQESRENFYIPRGDDFDSDHSTNGCGQAWNDNDNSDQKPGTGECELVTRWWSDATSGVVLTQVGLVVLLANLYHMLEAYMGTRFVMRGNELQDQVFTGSGCLSRSEVQVTCKTSWPVGEGSVSLEGILCRHWAYCLSAKLRLQRVSTHYAGFATVSSILLRWTQLSLPLLQGQFESLAWIAPRSSLCPRCPCQGQSAWAKEFIPTYLFYLAD